MDSLKKVGGEIIVCIGVLSPKENPCLPCVGEEVNDEPKHARQLAELLKDMPGKVNLIPFNPFKGSEFKRSSNNRIHRFRDHLQQQGILTTIRKTRGDDIGAACGQLAGMVTDRTRRSQRYVEGLGKYYRPAIEKTEN